MKKCSACGEVKPYGEFFFRDKTSKRLHSQCRKCYSIKRKAYSKMHYQKYGDDYRRRAMERKIIVRSQLRVKILDYLKDKKCITCGVDDIRVLDFDHINASEKSFSIARAISDLKSWDSILEEIKKCQILCANCHRIRTAEQFSWYKTIS